MRRSFGKTLLAAWRHLCYKLAHHRLLGLSLRNWLWALVVLPPLAAWIGRLAWTWGILLPILGAALLVGAAGARRKQYVVFAPDRSVSGDVEKPEQTGVPGSTVQLEVDEPLRCWASGRLGVEDKARALAGERASISFVHTREHVVMAQVRRTRFLLVAPVSGAEIGYWYAFFHPHTLEEIQRGTLYNGLAVRPALKLGYPSEGGEQRVQLYLGFEDEGARQRLLDDLRMDAPAEAF
jgi:hypothetical protein